MKKFQTFLNVLFVVCLCLCGIAQAAAQVADSTTHSSGVISFVIPDWVKYLFWGLLGLYEFLARRIPTIKNYSIISKIMQLIRWIAPNNNAKVPSQPHL